MEVLDHASSNALGGSAFPQQLKIENCGRWRQYSGRLPLCLSLVVATLTQNPTLTTFNSFVLLPIGGVRHGDVHEFGYQVSG